MSTATFHHGTGFLNCGESRSPTSEPFSQQLRKLVTGAVRGVLLACWAAVFLLVQIVMLPIAVAAAFVLGVAAVSLPVVLLSGSVGLISRILQDTGLA